MPGKAFREMRFSTSWSRQSRRREPALCCISVVVVVVVAAVGLVSRATVPARPASSASPTSSSRGPCRARGCDAGSESTVAQIVVASPRRAAPRPLGGRAFVGGRAFAFPRSTEAQLPDAAAPWVTPLTRVFSRKCWLRTWPGTPFATRVRNRFGPGRCSARVVSRWHLLEGCLLVLRECTGGGWRLSGGREGGCLAWFAGAHAVGLFERVVRCVVCAFPGGSAPRTHPSRRRAFARRDRTLEEAGDDPLQARNRRGILSKLVFATESNGGQVRRAATTRGPQGARHRPHGIIAAPQRLAAHASGPCGCQAHRPPRRHPRQLPPRSLDPRNPIRTSRAEFGTVPGAEYVLCVS
jgi:hypothetical protein